MWNELSTRHLLAMRAVVEEGTFGEAAKRLGFTQSAVSQQVAALEQIVGQPLFDRPSGPRRPVLTDAGRLMLEHAENILESVTAAELELERFARGVVGSLAIGAYQSISSRVLPTVLRVLRDDAADVAISVHVDEDGLYTKLLNGDLDLLCVSGDVPDYCEVRDLGADPHVALVPSGFPDGPVELLALSGQPMVGQPQHDTCGLEIEQSLERLGVTPSYAFRSHDNAAVQGMIGAGIGIAIVPLLTVDLNDPATEVRPTTPEIAPRQLHIVWLKGRTLSPTAQRFVEIAADVCERTLATSMATVNAA